METAIVILILIVAVYYIYRSMRSEIRGDDQGGRGSGRSCSSRNCSGKKKN